jgi:hypothetical protein
LNIDHITITEMKKKGSSCWLFQRRQCRPFAILKPNNRKTERERERERISVGIPRDPPTTRDIFKYRLVI